jgi:hypothetical protein
MEIRLLSLLRNIFFRLWANLPNSTLQSRAEDEQALSSFESARAFEPSGAGLSRSQRS